MLVTTKNFDVVLEELNKSNLLGVDTETSGLRLSSGIDYLTGICVASEDIKTYFPFRHPDNNLPLHYKEPLWEVLKPKNLAWHNRKFDMHSLKTLGLDPLELEGKQLCTMLLFHLWNEELYSFEMDSLAKQFIGEAKTIDMNGVAKAYGGWANIPADVIETYASHDPYVTLKLLKFIWPKIKEQELDKVYFETEMPFTRLLYKMEQRGVGVNTEFVKEKAFIGRKRMATIQRELGFNPASPKALGKYLLEELGLPVFAHTASCDNCKRKLPVESHEGPPSFNKKAMEDYDDILQESNNPAARLIAEYRGWQKAVTSLYEPLLERVSPDGRIRTNFKQHGTKTGRLSASEPNLQQVPRSSENVWNGNAKSSFTSGREGYTLIGWDYSQLELRIAASYGEERVLLEEFEKEDADPFSVLAPLIFGVLTPETRQDTKTFVYANLYGAGVAKIALQLNRSISEVDELYQRYKKSISGIMRVSSQVTRLIEARKFVKYWDGRRRHFRSKADAYKGWNSVCQGGGAQLVKKAMLRCEEFEDEDCQMVLQVHDEITFIIKDDRIEYYSKLIEEAMTEFKQFPVKFHVEGKAWK